MAGIRHPGKMQVGWRVSTWRRWPVVGRRRVVPLPMTWPVSGSVRVQRHSAPGWLFGDLAGEVGDDRSVTGEFAGMVGEAGQGFQVDVEVDGSPPGFGLVAAAF